MENAPMMVQEWMLILLPPGSVQELERRHHLDHWAADTVVGNLMLILSGTIEFDVRLATIEMMLGSPEERFHPNEDSYAIVYEQAIWQELLQDLPTPKDRTFEKYDGIDGLIQE